MSDRGGWHPKQLSLMTRSRNAPSAARFSAQGPCSGTLRISARKGAGGPCLPASGRISIRSMFPHGRSAAVRRKYKTARQPGRKLWKVRRAPVPPASRPAAKSYRVAQGGKIRRAGGRPLTTRVVLLILFHRWASREKPFPDDLPSDRDWPPQNKRPPHTDNARIGAAAQIHARPRPGQAEKRVVSTNASIFAG